MARAEEGAKKAAEKGAEEDTEEVTEEGTEEATEEGAAKAAEKITVGVVISNKYRRSTRPLSTRGLFYCRDGSEELWISDGFQRSDTLS
jgi:hypothetical protein